MSDRFKYNSPAIDYTALRLEAFANEHGVVTDQVNVFAALVQASARMARFGYPLLDGYQNPFDVYRDVPKTIPLLLARLSMRNQYEVLKYDKPNEDYGVLTDHCRWLRLVGVSTSDERIDETLEIVGAVRSKDDPVRYEVGVDGGVVCYTKHYYMESKEYAVRVTRPRVVEPYNESLIEIGLIYPPIKSGAAASQTY